MVPFSRFASNLKCLVFSVLEKSGSQHLKNWKKCVEKMKTHARSDVYATQVLLAAKRAVKDGTVVQQLQKVEAHKKAQI